MRRFLLHRREDASGVSGTGYVAEGIEFSDGSVVMRWRFDDGATNFYRSIKDVERIHGHEGRTEIEWVDTGLLARLADLVMLNPAPSPT